MLVLVQSAYHLAATAFGRAGLWRQGIRLAEMASEDGTALSPSTLTSVLGACAKGSRWREALELLRRSRSVLRQALSPPSSSSSFSENNKEEGLGSEAAVARAVAAGAGEGDGERGIVSKTATTRGMRVKRRREDNVVSVYTLAMVACRGAGRHAEGLGVLSMLREDGGYGDEAFFRVALKCCAKAGVVDGGGGGDGKEGGRESSSSGAAVADIVLRDMSAQGIRCRVEEFTDIVQVGLARGGLGGGRGGGSGGGVRPRIAG